MKKLIFTIIITVLAASVFADWQRDPASDVDKEFISGNEGIDTGTPPTDNSCWMASASNLLAGAGYGSGATIQERAEDIYIDMLNWQATIDPSNTHGTQDGGWIDTALTWWLSSSHNVWPSNPYNVVNVYGNKSKVPWSNADGAKDIGNMLRDYKQVGLSISRPRTSPGGSPSGGHAIAAWGDDGSSAQLGSNPDEVIVADSDRDTGGTDFQSYTYDDYTNPNPGGYDEGNGWYFNFSANHWFIKHIATLTPTDNPVDPGDGPTQLVVGSYKIHQDELESATDLHYTAWTDYDILGYNTDIDWQTSNSPEITESNTHVPSLTRSDITADWDLSDNPVPYCNDVTITTEFVLQGWNGVWYDDVYFTYPGGQETKYLQPPYDSSLGTDIRCDTYDDIPRLLADDFECTQEGPITKIYLWGSWDQDYAEGDPPGNVQKLHLKIYSDDPVGDDPKNPDDDPDNEASKPLELLWEGDFSDFSASQYSIVQEEYFWDPFTNSSLSWDNRIWQYEIDIPESQAFEQQGSRDNPEVYWLGVSADIDGYSYAKFGWKTTSLENGWNDKAVAWKDTLVKTDEFDFWEDRSSHSYQENGSISQGAYDCSGDQALRIGSGDSGSSVFLIMNVNPNSDQVKLRYKIPWAGAVAGVIGAELMVDGDYKGNIVSDGCLWQEMVLSGMAGDTADGEIEIKIRDTYPDYDGDIQITSIEAYSMAKDWEPLVYPDGHELVSQPVDMAFGVVTPQTSQGVFMPEFGWNIVTEDLDNTDIPDISGGYVLGSFDLFGDDGLLGQYRFVHQYPYTQDPETHTFTIQGGPGGSSAPCADFEDVKSPSSYPVGGFFNTQGYDVDFKKFFWLPSGSTTSGTGTVDASGQAGGSGSELELDNINAEFTFNYPVECLSLLFGEYGGNINLEVNGDFQNFNNFADINGYTIGGCSISVTNGYGNDKGTLQIQGTVNQFKIGGQELFIDDVCPSCGSGGSTVTAGNFRFGHSYGRPSKEKLWEFSDWMTVSPQQVLLSSGEPADISLNWDGRLPYPASDITPASQMPQAPDCTVYLEGDLNEDCCVNLLDLKMLASNWLECTLAQQR
ncbi:DUF7901 domain-containing protein [Sedimentisphaera salicampi]|uniref:DUF7901 domain-containing protein n=1 Tax=Sedimentisphaera salicampi TaxID=1941349 RepID=UPI000B9A5B5C|nr:hypothetical protein [Sedimentisphaera salicampi]OXU14839.1 hypothetical protein SMSP1_01334 [Sedimentisphaera salicampi]